jgi:transcriptional regulator with XRE-family HTH domain
VDLEGSAVLDFADQARNAIRTAMTVAGISQAELSRRVGITPKHTNRVLGGHDGLSFDLAEEMLRACGRRPVLRTQRAASKAGRDGLGDKGKRGAEGDVRPARAV